MLHSCHMLATRGCDTVIFSLTRIDRSPIHTFICYIETFKGSESALYHTSMVFHILDST